MLYYITLHYIIVYYITKEGMDLLKLHLYWQLMRQRPHLPIVPTVKPLPLL